jgi:tRNA threonylcarbamoyladenosine biosynthesis protein TsaB
MPSFRQISAQGPALVIDAASSLVQVGVLGPGGTARWESSSEESGVGIFQCLERLEVSPQEVASFIFCKGPGSVLGIRTAAMALRTWRVLKPRQVFAYCSLALVAHTFEGSGVAVIADARRDSWHHFKIGGGLQRLTVMDPSDILVMPENFRHWSTLPAGVRTVSYSLAALIPRVADRDLIHETDSPDAFLHEEPSYAKWTPQVHRAPTT